jgi:hypothetical protein
MKQRRFAPRLVWRGKSELRLNYITPRDYWVIVWAGLLTLEIALHPDCGLCQNKSATEGNVVLALMHY